MNKIESEVQKRVKRQASDLNKILTALEKSGIDVGHVYDAKDETLPNAVKRMRRYMKVLDRIEKIVTAAE